MHRKRQIIARLLCILRQFLHPITVTVRVMRKLLNFLNQHRLIHVIDDLVLDSQLFDLGGSSQQTHKDSASIIVGFDALRIVLDAPIIVVGAAEIGREHTISMLRRVHFVHGLRVVDLPVVLFVFAHQHRFGDVDLLSVVQEQ